MSALPPITQDPAQDPQQAKVRRLKQFIMARSQSLQQDVVDEHGAVLRKGPDRPQAIWQAIVEARRLKGQSKQRGEAMDAYLKGETEEFPDGWVRQPLQPVKAEGGMAEAREAAPVQSTMYDWVAGPASKIAGGYGQAIYNMGRGITNLQREGVLMAAPAPVRGLLDAMIPEVPARDVRTDALAAARMIGTGHLRDAAKLVYMNQDDAAGTRENMKRADAAMHDSAHWAARYLGNVGEFVGKMAGGPGGAAKQLFHAGGKVSALLSAKILEKTGKVVPKIVEGMVGTGVGLAAMEGIAGTDPEGGNPDLAQRAKNAAVGGAIGPLVSLTGDIGKMAFRGILGSGLKSLAPNEKVSVETLKRWAKQNGVLPVPNESPKDYLNRLVGGYLDAGAPMSKMTWPQIKARAVQAGIEGAGFSMMDVQFRDDLFGGIWDLSRGVIDGDEAMTASALEQLGRATDHYLVTAGGTAALRMPLKSIVPWQRRQSSPQSPAGQEPSPGGKPPTPESPSPTPIGFDPSFKPEQQAATQRAPEPTQRPRELPAPQQPTPDWGDAMRLGWQPKASPAPVVGAGPKIEAAQRTGVTMALPGTPHEFEVVGEWAIPSPSLRKALGISGEVEPRIPLEVFRQVINDASRIAALQSKGLLPGTEIDASGVKADGGKMRVIRLGQVLESPLSPDVRWVPRLTYTPRQPDQISPQQEEIVYSLSDILGKKMSLTQQDRVILSHVIDVMRDVAAERDASVAEAIAGLNQLGPAIAQGQPEMASDAIRMLSDLLTTKSMEVIAAEQRQRAGQAQRERSSAANPKGRWTEDLIAPAGVTRGEQAKSKSMILRFPLRFGGQPDGAAMRAAGINPSDADLSDYYIVPLRSLGRNLKSESVDPSDLTEIGDAVAGAKDRLFQALSEQEMLEGYHSKGHKGLENAPEALAKAFPNWADVFGPMGAKITPEVLADHARQRITKIKGALSEVEEIESLMKSYDPGAQQPDRSSESGALHVGMMVRGIKDAAGTLRDATAEVVKKVGRAAVGGYDSTIRSQAESIAARGGAPGLEFSRRARRAMSRSRSIYGEATRHLREAEDAFLEVGPDLTKDVPVTVTEGGRTIRYKKARWLAAQDRQLDEMTDAERDVATAINKAQLSLWNTYRAAGGLRKRKNLETGDVEFVDPGEREWAITQRVFSQDEKRGFDALMGSRADRLAFHDDLAAMNPSTLVPDGRGGKRPVTGADIEKWYQADIDARTASDPEKIAAYEVPRQLRHMPSTWRDYEVLEHDPLVALNYIAERQAGRAAVIEEFGQDAIPAAVRKERGITKEGATAAVAQLQKDLPDMGESAKAEIARHATELLAYIQGVNPEIVDRATLDFRDAMSIPRSVGAFFSFIHDIGAMATETVPTVGLRRTMRALVDYARETFQGRPPKEAARSIGVLHQEMNNLDIDAVDTAAKKVARGISALGEWFEQTKTVMHDKAVLKFIEDAKLPAGTGITGWLLDHVLGRKRSGDIDVLTRMFRFTEAEANALVSGTASAQLEAQFRHELVQRSTARGRMAERSRAAASTRWKSFVRYLGFATKRVEVLVREGVAAAKTLADPAASMGRKTSAIKRVMERGTGLAFSGMAGQALYYGIMGMLAGEGLDGFKRWWSELVNFPTEMIARGTVGQALAGPLGTAFTAATFGQPDDAVRLFELSNMVYNVSQAVSRGGKPLDAAIRLAEDMNLVPRQVRQVASAAQLAMLGEDNMADIARRVNSWKQKSSIVPVFSTPTKQPEFYEAVGEVKDILRKHKGDYDSMWAKVETKVREALDLQPSDSVSAKIRSLVFLQGLNDGQVDKLTDFLGDVDMRRIHDHDAMVLQLAREIGKMEGVETTPWSEALRMASRQAALQAPNVWGDLLDRAKDDLAARMERGEPSMTDAEELARSIASYPGSILRDSAFDDKEKAMVTKADTEQLSRLIQHKILAGATARLKRNLGERTR